MTAQHYEYYELHMIGPNGDRMEGNGFCLPRKILLNQRIESEILPPFALEPADYLVRVARARFDLAKNYR